MVERSKKPYTPPAIEDCGRITERTLQVIHGSPEATDPVQPTKVIAVVEIAADLWMMA
jgi:hypothetical protein